MEDKSSNLTSQPSSQPKKLNTTLKQGEPSPKQANPTTTPQNIDQEDTTCSNIGASIYAFFHTLIYKVSGDLPDMKFDI